VATRVPLDFFLDLQFKHPSTTKLNMTRFTNIGMPKKTFVSSAAEETRPEPEAAKTTTTTDAAESSTQTGPKKRKRRGTRGLDPEEAERRKLQHQEFQKEASRRQKMGWGRDPAVASKSCFS
jgi:hypothetical protein